MNNYSQIPVSGPSYSNKNATLIHIGTEIYQGREIQKIFVDSN